jgi:hypothetical protein
MSNIRRAGRESLAAPREQSPIVRVARVLHRR